MYFLLFGNRVETEKRVKFSRCCTLWHSVVLHFFNEIFIHLDVIMILSKHIYIYKANKHQQNIVVAVLVTSVPVVA